MWLQGHCRTTPCQQESTHRQGEPQQVHCLLKSGSLSNFTSDYFQLSTNLLDHRVPRFATAHWSYVLTPLHAIRTTQKHRLLIAFNKLFQNL